MKEHSFFLGEKADPTTQGMDSAGCPILPSGPCHRRTVFFHADQWSILLVDSSTGTSTSFPAVVVHAWLVLVTHDYDIAG